MAPGRIGGAAKEVIPGLMETVGDDRPNSFANAAALGMITREARDVVLDL